MPVMLLPLVLAALGGGGIGAFIGNLFGKSKAAEAIERLQKMIQELQKVNRDREAEINRLKGKISELEAEVNAMKAQRGIIEKFIRWIIREHPEILERYRKMQETKVQILKVEAAMKESEEVVNAEIASLMSTYPEEMKTLLEKAG
jgi:predicted RNase H-like nuclease (RuvC/YqgF family)